MRTIKTKLFTFEELSEEAQNKALNNLQDINVDHDWWDCTYEDAKNIGLKITSFGLDRSRHAKGEFLLAANEVAANIFKEHGETCETFKTAESFMDEWQPVFDEYMAEPENMPDLEDQLLDLENNFLESLIEDYSISLQNEYEYLYSDEAVKDTIEANNYEFTEYGKRY